MGIAAYNRGSRAISRQIDEQLKDSTATVAVVHPAPEPPPPPPDPGPLGFWDLTRDPVRVQVGDRVFCTVTACRGWYTVTEVAPKRGGVLQIKTTGFRGWGYGHNFTRKPPAWMTGD